MQNLSHMPTEPSQGDLPGIESSETPTEPSQGDPARAQPPAEAATEPSVFDLPVPGPPEIPGGVEEDLPPDENLVEAYEGDLPATPPPVPQLETGGGAAVQARFWTPQRIAQAARSGTLLAVIGASIALFVGEMIGWTKWLDKLLTNNTLPLVGRHQILVAMAGTGALFALVAWGALIRLRRQSALDRVRSVALLLSPLAVLGLAAPLLRLHAWKDNPMTLGCGLAIVAYLLEKTVLIALNAAPGAPSTWLVSLRKGMAALCPRVWRVLPVVIVLAGIIGYGLLVSILTIRHHHRLGTAAFDLGGYDNIFFNALHGRPLRGTVAVQSGENWSSIRSHAEFSVYAFLPFYAIRPCAEALLCIQAFMVGLGALPVYLLAARRLSRGAGLVLALAYLLFPAIHSGNFYDFHFQPLGSTLILWCFYLLDCRRNIAFALVFIVALGCREDVSISLAVAGFLMVFSGYRPVAGGVVGIISAAYFLVVKFVVMPHFGTWWFTDMYKELLPSGDSGFFGVVKTLIANPLYALGTLLTREKVLHVLKIFLPLAFVPLRRAGLWFGFVPAILGTILTTGYHPTTDTTFQYIYYWVPFIFVITVIVLQRIVERNGKKVFAATIVALTFATLTTSYHWGVVFQKETFAAAWGHINLEPLTQQERQTRADLLALGSKIPRNASASMSEWDVPQFSNRLTIYTLRAGGANNADWILYRKDSGDAGAKPATEALQSGKYRWVEERGNYVLLKRVGVP